MGWGGCWKEDMTVSHSFANEGRERSTDDTDTLGHRLLTVLDQQVHVKPGSFSVTDLLALSRSWSRGQDKNH